MSNGFDLAIVGAGIAGASMAFFAAQRNPSARVLLLEREGQPGLHSTGRSAAMFEEAYGPAAVRALTRASRAFLERPPPGFATVPLITPRGAMFVGSAEQVPALRHHLAALHAEGLPARWLDTAEIQHLCPVLRPQAAHAAVHDPVAADMDVDALHQGFLRGAKAAGTQVLCNAEVQRIERGTGRWRLHTAAGVFEATRLANAAGAWADAIATLAGVPQVQLQPRRRSAFIFEPPAAVDCSRWPMVIDADETWYLKPDAGLLLGSPANADDVPAHDVMAEELDVATGIHRIETATTLTIRRPRRSWAGLRSFVPDGVPVLGPEPRQSDFIWVAGQGGYGIQTSVAAGQLTAALALGDTPAAFADAALLAALSPARMRS